MLNDNLRWQNTPLIHMHTAPGIVTKPSPHPVPAILDRLAGILRAKGIAIFARIDHSGEAAKVGIAMPATELLIFGNPRAGTPIMLAAPLSAIDLPLKALAWEDREGKVWLSYNDPDYLKGRFALSDELVGAIAGIGSLVDHALA
jgi:uncharacterized protein (DUF302 family)